VTLSLLVLLLQDWSNVNKFSSLMKDDDDDDDDNDDVEEAEETAEDADK